MRVDVRVDVVAVQGEGFTDAQAAGCEQADDSRPTVETVPKSTA